MGKKDGFLLYERRNTPAQEPAGRIGSFEEFHTPLPLQERRRQAARCMNCGVPFCQSGVELGGMVTGCPLHNLIPEWNDMLYLGNTRHALDRLTKTNCFPEFTGRVCPALCEAACTCGLNGDSVTVRENELSIIEEAFEKGWMQPQPPRTRSGKRIAIVGSGPSGLAAAYVLNRRGHSVTVFEKADRPGGLLMYGIPNMKLDKKIVERRIRLMEAEGVVFRTGMKVGEDVSADEIRRTYDAVLLCCGAGQPRDLKLPGRDAEGVYFAVDYLTAATRHLLDGTPSIDAKGKRVVIVQFLKGGQSGEIPLLAQLGAKIFRGKGGQKFVFQMNEAEKAAARAVQNENLTAALAEPADLLILDEAGSAWELDMVDKDLLRRAVLERPAAQECVLTAHKAPQWMLDAADYSTEMKCRRHPYQKGIKARKGIEY